MQGSFVQYTKGSSMKNAFTLIVILLSFSAVAQQSLLSNEIPYPYYDVQKSDQNQDNYMTILNSGIASFEKRIQLIQNAKDTLILEYFIFEKDKAGRIILQELVSAAKRGVKVKILVDKSMAVVTLDEYDVQVLSENKIELRFYNAAPLLKLSTIQFRNHRKVIIADNTIGIVGGRNIADDYFDLSESYNFIDRDVLVEGPIIKTITASFEEYFEHEISERTVLPIHAKKIPTDYEERLSKAKQTFERSAKDRSELDEIRALGQKILATTQSKLCPEVTWSTDRPGGTFWRRLVDEYSDDYRYLRKTIYDKMIVTDKKITISSPYIMNNKYSRRLMFKMLDKGVEIETYTNSLSSTDAAYVAANLYKDVFRWTKKGIKTNLHQGDYIPETEVLNPKIAKARWGTHSKTYLFESNDQQEFMISTYNVDNRSNHYNSELGLFCKGSPELFKDVADNVKLRMYHGMEVLKKRKARDNRTGKLVNRFGKHPEGLTSMRLMALPSWLFKFLL